MLQEPPAIPSRRLRMNVTAGLYGLMAAFSLAWGFYTDRPDIWFHPDPLYDLPWPVTIPLGLGAGVSLGLGVSALTAWLARRSAWARGLVEEFRTLLGDLSTREILLVSALSSVAEELFFRGILLPGFSNVLSDRSLGLALSSLAFGVLHVPANRRMVTWTFQAILMGFALGFLFLFTGDLTVCVAAHFVVNHRNLSFVKRWPAST